MLTESNSKFWFPQINHYDHLLCLGAILSNVLLLNIYSTIGRWISQVMADYNGAGCVIVLSLF